MSKTPSSFRLIRSKGVGVFFVTQNPADIPDEVLEAYKLYRPTPLIRARRLEKALATPAHIYFKYEGVSPVGSHKPNTAVPQAYYNKVFGIENITTETGAGHFLQEDAGHEFAPRYAAWLAEVR